MLAYLLSSALAFAVAAIYVVELGGLGLLLLFFDRRYKRTFAAMRGWPSATATITSAGWARARPWLPGRRRNPQNYPLTLDVAYTYSVGGQDYVGHGVALSGTYSPAQTQDFIQQHPPGSQVSVVYDPADPRYAYLDRTTRPSPLWLIGSLLGFSFALPGCCFLLIIPIVTFANLGQAAGTAQSGNLPQVSNLAFRPDGQVLAGAGCNTFVPGSSACQQGAIYLWDVSQPYGARLLGSLISPGAGAPNSLAFSPDGATLAASLEDGTLAFVDVSHPAAPRALGAPLATHSFALQVAFSPVGKTLAVGEYSNEVELWDVTDPAAPHVVGKPISELPDPANSLAFSPNGKLLAVEGDCINVGSNVCRPAITLWDVSSPASPRALAAPFGGTQLDFASLAFSPDSQRLAADLDDKSIGLWDLSSPAAPRQLGSPLATSGYLGGLAFSSDGKLLVFDNGLAASLWDVSDSLAPRRAGQAEPPGGVYSLALSPAGPTLAVVSDGDVYLYDVTDPAAPGTLGRPLVPPKLTAPR